MLQSKLVVHFSERCFGYIEGFVDAMSTVHQHLRFHYRNKPCFLTEGCIAGKEVGVNLDTVPAREFCSNGYDSSPLGETSAEAVVFIGAIR